MVLNTKSTLELPEVALKRNTKQVKLEKEIAIHSSILAWRIPWTEEPDGLYIPWSPKELRHEPSDLRAHTHTWAHTHTSQLNETPAVGPRSLLTPPCMSDVQPWLRATAPVLRTGRSWGGNCRGGGGGGGGGRTGGEGIACNWNSNTGNSPECTLNSGRHTPEFCSGPWP